ncbi:MAG: T9SS type A sorting domain-containing protein [Chitinophagales bacterium]
MKNFCAFSIAVILISSSAWLILNEYTQKNPDGELEIKQAQGEDYFFLQHSFPYGKIDYAAHRDAAASFKKSSALKTTDLTQWEFVGPANIGGRLVDIEFDPVNPQITYIAAASGGVFKSSDWLGTWVPIFDNETTLSMGDIAIAPSDPNIIYAGTGEANGGSGSLTYDANGIYKSADAGSTWTNIGLQNTSITGRVAVHPTDPDIVFAATMGDLYGPTPDRGLYKTSDGGATWNNVLFVNDSTGVVDVVINPADPDIVFATTWMRTRHANTKDYAGAESGVWKSTDGGNTFSQLDAANGLPAAGTEYSRIGIDLCASKPHVVYCVYIAEDYSFYGLYRSIDDGNTWTETNDAALNNSMGNGQGYWYGRVKCDPTDADILYLIGFDVYKTDDGGNSWNTTFNYVHVDQHAIAIDPLDHEYVLAGNDGGVQASHDGGSSWSNIPVLPISQVYRSAIDESNPSSLFFGLQDNGTVYTTSGAVDEYAALFGGDGFQSLVDPLNNQNILVGYQYGNIYRTYDGGYSWYPSTGYGAVYGTGNWNYPLTADPQNSNVVYTGTQSVFKSEDFGGFWYSISPELTTLDNSGTLVFGTITFIDVSPLNSDIIYAGTDDGKVWNTLNGGGTWNDVSSGLPDRWVTCVETDPFIESTAYVTLSGYRFHDDMNHVYKTSDDGATWVDIGSGLPDVPCNCIISDPVIENILYLATDVGVYYTSDAGASWNPAGEGIPIVVCSDLKIHNPTRTLVVGTYGRSAYKINIDLMLGAEAFQNMPFDFSVFPSPVRSGIASVTYSFPQSCIAELSLYDMKGRMIRSQKASGEKGNNKSAFNFKDIESGMYLLQLNGGNESFTLKVLVQ